MSKEKFLVFVDADKYEWETDSDYESLRAVGFAYPVSQDLWRQRDRTFGRSVLPRAGDRRI
jgi:hypothetical protein